MMSPPPVPMLDVKGKGRATRLPELSIDNQFSDFGHRPSTPRPSPQPQDSPTSRAYGTGPEGCTSHLMGANSSLTPSILPPSPFNTRSPPPLIVGDDLNDPRIQERLLYVLQKNPAPAASDAASQASSSTTPTTVSAASDTGVSSMSLQPMAVTQASTDFIPNSTPVTGAGDSSAPANLNPRRPNRSLPKKGPAAKQKAASRVPLPCIAQDIDILARPAGSEIASSQEGISQATTVTVPTRSTSISTTSGHPSAPYPAPAVPFANGLDALAEAAMQVSSSAQPSIAGSAYAPSATEYNVDMTCTGSQADMPVVQPQPFAPVPQPYTSDIQIDHQGQGGYAISSAAPIGPGPGMTISTDAAMSYSGPTTNSSTYVDTVDTAGYYAASSHQAGSTTPDEPMPPSDHGHSTFIPATDSVPEMAQVADAHRPEESNPRPNCSFHPIYAWSFDTRILLPGHLNDGSRHYILASSACAGLLWQTVFSFGVSISQLDLERVYSFICEAYRWLDPDADPEVNGRLPAEFLAMEVMLKNDIFGYYPNQSSSTRTWDLGMSWSWNGLAYGSDRPITANVFIPFCVPFPSAAEQTLQPSATPSILPSSEQTPSTMPLPTLPQSIPPVHAASEQEGDYFDDVENSATSSQETAITAAAAPSPTTEELVSASVGTGSAAETPTPDAEVELTSHEAPREVSTPVMSAPEPEVEASMLQRLDEAVSVPDRAEVAAEQREDLAAGEPVAVVHVSTFVDEEVQTVHAATEITKVDAYVQVEPVRFSQATQAEPPLVERGIQVEQPTPVEEAASRVEVAIQAEAVGVAQGIQVEAVGVSQGIQVEPVEVEVEIDALVALFDTMKLEASELATKVDDPRPDEAQEPRLAIEITEVENPIRVKVAAHVEQANQVEEVSPVERPTKAETPVSVDGSTQEAQVDKPDNFAQTNFLTAFLNEWHSARDARSVNANNALCRWRSAQFALLYTQSMCEVPDDIVKGLTDIILSMSANGPALTLTHSPKRSARKRTTRPLSGLKPFRESSPCRRTARQVLGRRLKPIHPYKPPQVWRA